MSKKTKDTQVELPKKILDALPEGWSEGANSMKEEDLKKEIVQCEGNLYVITQAKDGDTKLYAAREEVKGMLEPYREASKTQKAKITYALWLLESRGVNLDNQDTV
jgi:hypothetical protein